jgi:hypothetical protein
LDGPDGTWSGTTPDAPISDTLLVQPNTGTQTTITATLTTQNIAYHIVNYTTTPPLASTIIIPGIWATNLIGLASGSLGDVYYYTKLYEIPPGPGTPILIAEGSFLSSVTVNTVQSNNLYQLQVPNFLLQSLNSQIQLQIWAGRINAPAGQSGSRTLTIEMRDNTQSNVVTTLASNLVGATGAQGATGYSPWISTNYIGVTGPGYTGTGYTGDVMVFGNLYVQGGIDPTYLALEPQSSNPLPPGLDGIWIENGGSFRVQKTRLDDFSGTTPGYIDINPITNPQITLSDGGLPEINVVTLNNNAILLQDNSGIGNDVATINANTMSVVDTVIGSSINQIVSEVNGSGSNILLGASNLATSNSQSLRLETTLTGDAFLTHQELGGTTRNLGISSTGAITLGADNIDLSATGRLIIPTFVGGEYLDYNPITANLTLSSNNTGGGNNPMLTLNQNDTNGGGVSIKMFKNISTNGASIGEMSFVAKTAIAGNPEREYARIDARIRNNNTGNVDGSIGLSARVNDVLTEIVRVNGVDNQTEFLQSIDMNNNGITNSLTGGLAITSGTGLLTLTGGSSTSNGTLITTSATTTGSIQLNNGTLGRVDIITNNFGGLFITANGGSGVGNIFISQTGTQNQTTIQMGGLNTAYWSNVIAASPSFSKLGCFSSAGHRMRALGYSTSDQSNTSFGLTGPYFGRATLVPTVGGGTVTVANPTIGANDLILVTPIGNTNEGLLSVTISALTSFTILSSNAADARTVNFMIVINTL